MPDVNTAAVTQTVEIRRKLFHIILFVFPAAYLVWSREVMIQVLAGAFLLDLVMESLRLRYRSVNAWLMGLLPGVHREEENTKLSGVFFALLGFLAAAVLFERQAAMAGMVCLACGDVASSLARLQSNGRAGPKDWRSVGACFVMCVAATVWWLPWEAALAGAAAAAVMEHWTGGTLDDNVVIPLASGAVIHWMIG